MSRKFLFSHLGKVALYVNSTMAGFVPFSQSSDISLSILLVADNAVHLKGLLNGLQEVKDETEDILKVYSCESLSQVLKVSDPPQVDFVVFCVNLKRLNAITEIEESILRLDRAFLLDRICLICDSSQSYGSLMPKILHLKHKYQLHVLWGNLETKSKEVSDRLSRLASAVCGANSGFPIITHRSWHRRQRQDHDFSPIPSDATF